MAIQLDDDMKAAINNAFTDGVPIVWATSGKDGQPSLGFFGTTQAFGDDKIAYETLERMNEHLGTGNGLNLSETKFRVGKTLKFDPQAERFVGSAEADPDQNRLSNESPIGRAVVGCKKGDKIEVVTPKGAVKYEITAISRA